MLTPHRLRAQRLAVLLALPLGLTAAGCRHRVDRPTTSAAATSDPCVTTGAARSSCTLAQRICLVAGDLPSTVGQPDFIPTASYTARWQSHVSAWLFQLTEIAKEPTIESYAQAARRKLEQVNASEHDRRLIIENGDLLYALKVLGQKAKTAVPPVELSCPLPE